MAGHCVFSPQKRTGTLTCSFQRPLGLLYSIIDTVTKLAQLKTGGQMFDGFIDLDEDSMSESRALTKAEKLA